MFQIAAFDLAGLADAGGVDDGLAGGGGGGVEVAGDRLQAGLIDEVGDGERAGVDGLAVAVGGLYRAVSRDGDAVIAAGGVAVICGAGDGEVLRAERGAGW